VVDQDGEVVDVFLQKRRDGKAAKRFFRRLLGKHQGEPRKIVTDKLRSYGVAHRELIPETIHDTSQYANNRAELPHEPTRVREQWKFKSDLVGVLVDLRVNLSIPNNVLRSPVEFASKSRLLEHIDMRKVCMW